MQGVAATKPGGYGKIRFCGEQAAKDGLEYFWVDTCCIDKSSSAEIQEAITTMFSFYRGSSSCYVYLADVSVPEAQLVSDTGYIYLNQKRKLRALNTHSRACVPTAFKT